MLGDRLRLARKRAGLSLRGLADRLEGRVSAQAIGKYERGEMTPASGVLIALAKALDVPMGYLMSPMGAELAGIDFRKKSGTSAQDRARVEAEVLEHVERYLSVEEILDLDSAEWDRPFKTLQTLNVIEDAESLADHLRVEWQLGGDPIPDMTELLEEHGIKVFVLPLPNNVSGLTCLIGRPAGQPQVPVIVVNRNHNIERRRLTLAHELAHRLIDPDSPCDLEKASNRFAGAFLMPADHVRHEIGRRRHSFGYPELIQLKRLYRVSAAAFVVRLEQIGVISRSTLTHIFQTVGKGWRRQEPEPLDDDGTIEAPRRFERLCYWALSEDYISLPKAAELLRKPVDVIRADYKGPAADGNHSQ